MTQPLVDFLTSRYQNEDPHAHRQARLLTWASLLTSLFSLSYLVLSIHFGYAKGVYLMGLNVIGFLCIPFLLKTTLSIRILGNLYVAVGAIAIYILTWFSGGMWSAIYPWIVSIPVLALLVVDQKSALGWLILSALIMFYIGVQSVLGMEFPVEYDQRMKTEWYFMVISGLILIIYIMARIFESNRSDAVNKLIKQNSLLVEQKEMIVSQTDELNQLLDERDYIIQILAHDLRSPLNAIKGTAGEIRSQLKDPALIDVIDVSAEKAQSLISRVLRVGAEEKKMLEVHLEHIDVARELESTIAMFDLQASQKAIKIHTELIRGIAVEADKTYLAQVFDNLLSNAIKFSERDAEITVRSYTREDQLSIEFIDQGPGISEDDQKKLFDKYARLTAQPTAGESSTGLGLALVKRYIEMINGKIECESQPGSGTTFRIQLPLA